MRSTRLQRMQATAAQLGDLAPDGFRELLDLAESVRVYVVAKGVPQQHGETSPEYRQMYDAFLRFIQS